METDYLEAYFFSLNSVSISSGKLLETYSVFASSLLATFIWEKDGLFIVIENIKRLQYNILNHSLVPEHTIIDDKQVDEVMKKYNIKNKMEFPDISRFDPVARVIGLRPGDVCKIIRPSKTAITTEYYRVCI